MMLPPPPSMSKSELLQLACVEAVNMWTYWPDEEVPELARQLVLQTVFRDDHVKLALVDDGGSYAYVDVYDPKRVREGIEYLLDLFKPRD